MKDKDAELEFIRRSLPGLPSLRLYCLKYPVQQQVVVTTPYIVNVNRLVYRYRHKRRCFRVMGRGVLHPAAR